MTRKNPEYNKDNMKSYNSYNNYDIIKNKQYNNYYINNDYQYSNEKRMFNNKNYKSRKNDINENLLGNNFKKNTDLDIFIENNKIKYSKEYKFNKFGNNTVKFIIYENLDMNYMFQNVPNLISIEMISIQNAKINSMISAFENCYNLEELVIEGFDTSEIKSMHKLFYRTSLTDKDLARIHLNTKNVEDISYMFSFTNFKELNLSFIDSKKLMNMSHLFKDCSSLKNIIFNNLDTNQVKDMSYMFQTCSGLDKLD